MVALVLGDACPPEEMTTAPSTGPIKSLKVEYAPPTRKQIFWSPFFFMGKHRLAYFDIGWLGVYLLAYLPVMFVSKRVLRVV